MKSGVKCNKYDVGAHFAELRTRQSIAVLSEEAEKATTLQSYIDRVLELVDHVKDDRYRFVLKELIACTHKQDIADKMNLSLDTIYRYKQNQLKEPIQQIQQIINEALATN